MHNFSFNDPNSYIGDTNYTHFTIYSFDTIYSFYVKKFFLPILKIFNKITPRIENLPNNVLFIKL